MRFSTGISTLNGMIAPKRRPRTAYLRSYFSAPDACPVQFRRRVPPRLFPLPRRTSRRGAGANTAEALGGFSPDGRAAHASHARPLPCPSRRVVAPRQNPADVAQGRERVVVFGGAFREIRPLVGDARQQSAKFDARQAHPFG